MKTTKTYKELTQTVNNIKKAQKELSEYAKKWDSVRDRYNLVPVEVAESNEYKAFRERSKALHQMLRATNTEIIKNHKKEHKAARAERLRSAS